MVIDPMSLNRDTTGLVLLGIHLTPAKTGWHRLALQTTRGEFVVLQQTEPQPCRVVMWLMATNVPDALLLQSAAWLIKRGVLMLAIPPWETARVPIDAMLAWRALVAHLNRDGLPAPLLIAQTAHVADQLGLISAAVGAHATACVPVLSQVSSGTHTLAVRSPDSHDRDSIWDWQSTHSVEPHPLDAWHAYLMNVLFKPVSQ